MTKRKYVSSITLDGKHFQVGSLVKYVSMSGNEYWALITKIETTRSIFFNLLELSDKESFWVPYEDLIPSLIEMRCIFP